ncbi:MAG: hypothetical protein FXF47_05660 [Candidatus Mcinerneyibacterium aminivorans]|uniref:Uncharacterized protein n=1 Tax=Candidatus Mcinerneyibacterium aminivorans TaxID=2703815 RepID=A0A5D0MHN6_9BACT|nr:MAG: hypothetical protein FXF47_05660 [Candidatus Mcinerneyibacterium aminivorans]
MEKKKTIQGLVIITAFFIAVATGCTATVERKSEKPISVSTDYLDESVVLAAFYMEDGGFSETRYYPANILSSAGEETNGEYEVVSLVGDFDVAKGDTHWTENVIVESHPAKKNELEEGMVVLFTRSENNLAEARWNRGIISSTEELYKDRVIIDYVWYLNKEDESDRQYNIPVENIRIIDSEG